MSPPFFRGRGALALVVLGLTSLLFATLLLIEGRSHGSLDTGLGDSYSYSAVGHRAFVELLEDLGFTVTRSRMTRTRRDQVDAAWVFAEAPPDEQSERGALALEQLVRDASSSLVILPKRRVAELETAPSEDVTWVEAELRLPPGERAARVLEDALEAPPRVLSTSPPGSTEFSAIDGSRFTVDVESLQLLEGDGLEPLVFHSDGVLVGRLTELLPRDVIVVSDPDLIANHRIDRADHAAVAVWALRQLPPSERLVMIDEVIHGHSFEPSLWRELTSFPLVLALVQALLATVFLVWAGALRFGAPLPIEEPLGAGRRTLIGNTAELLLRGGHAAHSLRRYFRRNVEAVAEALHLPADASHAAQLSQLAAASERLDRGEDPGRIAHDIDQLAPRTRRIRRADQARRVLRVAHRIHRWREEMVHGPTADPADR